MIILIMKKPSLFLLIVLFSAQLYAVSELHIKGIFLEKFTHLIEWPQNDASSFTICLVNDEEFAQVLRRIYADKTLKNKPVQIMSLSDEEPIPACQILFIGKEAANVKRILQTTSEQAVLSVTDHKPFALDGIMITMFLNQKRFSYIINNKEAQNANIRISYLLLKSAQEVIK